MLGKIKRIVAELQKKIDDYTESINMINLELQVGVYRANSLNDRLIDAIANANLTRELNETNNVLFYSDEVRSKALFKTEMILRIDEALEKKEFLLPDFGAPWRPVCHEHRYSFLIYSFHTCNIFAQKFDGYGRWESHLP